MSEPRMRFASRADAALTVSASLVALVSLVNMGAALITERYGLAAFSLLLVLVNGAVLASVASRMDYP